MAKLTQDQTMNLAKSYVGVSESPAYSNRVLFSSWYGFVGPWCAMFVSYILTHAGYPFHVAYCPDIVNWAQKSGRWFTSRSQAQPGDLILYSFGGRRADHVGFVLGRLSDGRMMTVEGNTGSNNRDGGSVQIRYRNSGIIGFVRMDYVSAAPPANAWPAFKRILAYGVSPGDDIATWKLYMNALGVAPEFRGMNLEQLRTFGKTTSPNAAYRFSVLWNGVYGLKPGEKGHLVENHQVDADDWQALIWAMATRK